LKYSARRAQAFTLIEMLVVLVVGTAVVGLCITMTGQAQRFWVLHQSRLAAGRSAWQCLNRIARDVRTASAAGSVVGTNATGTMTDALSDELLNRVEPGELDGVDVDDDTLELSTGRAADFEGVHVPGRVRFAVKRDESGRVLGVVRQSAPPGVALENGYEWLMSECVVSLDFEYLDDSGAWQSTWRDGGETPRAVRITVAAVPDRIKRKYDIQRFTTVVTLAGSARIPG